MSHTDQPLLAGIELLSGMDSERLASLAKRCRRHRFQAGDIVLDQGDDQQHEIYLVLEGTVRIVNYSSFDREIAFANIREGGYFGELAALTDQPRSASVIAVTDCHLAALAPAAFRSLLMAHPEIAIRVITRLAEMVQRCDQRIMDLSMLSAVQRVHREIIRLARPDAIKPDEWVVNALPTQREIASHVSTTRETVARAMTVLNVAGIAERRGKSLRIQDYQRLAQLAEVGPGQMLAAR